MIVLVTGASGFIGRNCCLQLCSQGHEVHAVSSTYQSDEKIHWHTINLLDTKTTQELFKKIRPTHLLHLAWDVEPGKYWWSINNYHWVKASLTLIEQFVGIGGKRVVVAGTCAEYDWGYETYIEDITPLEPATLYGVCKHSLQLMLSSYALLKGFSYAWGRIFSIYGPNEHPDRLCSSVIQALLNGEKIKCGNGALIRDYLHVCDVASAFVQLLQSDHEGPINIGSGRGIKLKNFVEMIEAKIGNYNCLEFSKAPNISNDTPKIVADISRLTNSGWKSTFDIERGLDHTIKWFRDNRN